MAEIQTWENPSASQSIESPQWVVNDLIYRIKQKVDNPFNKEAYAVVTDEDGDQNIALFYNDNNEWVFRYSSSSIGKKHLLSSLKFLN